MTIKVFATVDMSNISFDEQFKRIIKFYRKLTG